LFGNGLGLGLDPLFRKIVWEFMKYCGKPIFYYLVIDIGQIFGI